MEGLPWPCQPCHYHASLALTMPTSARLCMIMTRLNIDFPWSWAAYHGFNCRVINNDLQCLHRNHQCFINVESTLHCCLFHEQNCFFFDDYISDSSMFSMCSRPGLAQSSLIHFSALLTFFSSFSFVCKFCKWWNLFWSQKIPIQTSFSEQTLSRWYFSDYELLLLYLVKIAPGPNFWRKIFYDKGASADE